uniref:GPI ethanolamine phosphate transferase-like protein cimlC n=1 Tax=Colletotrichum incanum TaxID=1573173 RepID=CIMLC_COLIC|nr:TPA: GPI-ethanolamine phosphate transferase homolog [Colletotrichum incanum]
MVQLRQTGLLLAANVLIIASLVVFMAGYFRPQPSLTVALLDEDDTQNSMPGKPPFDKVVFMVVDALRSDFVYGEKSGFKFTQSLIRSGSAVPFTAMAALPTLTVSRLKALTQGTAQSFLDAWVNVANSPDMIRLEGEDTWLSRLKASRGYKQKVVFYGVDMWLDLYPDIFDRYEGFYGFYMPDVNSLDANITLRIPEELKRDDWVSLVMHYEGLDSLAHQGGLRSSQMVPKQAEMDKVIQMMYEGILSEPHLNNTLIVLLGDHGMDDRGNHGGDTPGELASAMTLISPHLKPKFSNQQSPLSATADYKFHSVINQVDIVPTLAGLLGFSIPAGNIGEFIPEMLSAFTDADDQLHALLLNAEQIMRALKLDIASSSEKTCVCGPQLGACQVEEERLLCLWRRVEEAERASVDKDDENRRALQIAIRDFTKPAQERLSRPTKNLGFRELYLGVVGILLSFLLLHMSHSLGELIRGSRSSIMFFTAIGIHGLAMFKPQVVKDEHVFWYPFSLVWISYQISQRIGKVSSKMYLFAAFWPVYLQLGTQALNHYGSPFQSGQLIDDLLFDHPLMLWTLTIVTYVPITTALGRSLDTAKPLSMALPWGLCGMSLSYKLLSTFHYNPELFDFIPDGVKERIVAVDYVFFLRTFWTALAAVLVYVVLWKRLTGGLNQDRAVVGIVQLASLYLRTQTRPKNLVLFALFDLQLQWFQHLSVAEISLTVLLLGQSSFFATGRGNTFASLDFVNGFNGLDGTNVIAVTLQTLLSNWVAPTWWSLAGLLLLHRGRGAAKGNATTVKSPHIQTNGQRSTPAATVMNGNGANAKSAESKNNAKLGNTMLELIAFDTAFAASSSLAVMLSCLWLQDAPELWTVLAPNRIEDGRVKSAAKVPSPLVGNGPPLSPPPGS